ncbi:MAG: aminotransferase class V-fold PLP-dependent enzyme [Planctomycetia bacterium]|nr:aminotransferase class V-fold PLP-dependent enzyme [Planctomycetia bacterium]
MDWTALRAEFPVTRRWAYFDHAAVAPLSARARQAMQAWTDDLAEHGYLREPQWLQRIEAVRASAAKLLHADPLDVAFIKNTSEGIGIVAEGLRWQPGDNAVTAQEEYPANIYPWLNLQERGVEVRFVPTRDRRLWVEDFQARIDARTRVVSISQVEYASGFRNDLDALGALCRQHGVFFFVDAIQGLGVLPLDVRQTPVDALAADGHKWLLGPEGLGVFWIRREALDQLHPVGVGWNSVVRARDFSRLDFTLKPHAGRWESGSLNVAGIAGLGASLDLLHEIGLDRVHDRIIELTDYCCERVTQAGFEVYSSRQPAERSGIVSLATSETASRELVARCRARNIIVNRRAGRLRISPHCYNSREEIDRLVEVLSESS